MWLPLASLLIFGLPPSGWVLNEIHADPHPELGDANGDGRIDAGDEFIEIVNAMGVEADMAGFSLADRVQVRHVFPWGSSVPAGCAMVVFGKEPILVELGGARAQAATTGGLSLNNSGDTITLADRAGEVVAQVSWGRAGGDDQSLTLDVDVTGAVHVRHSLAAGSGGALFSPGRRVDGSSFAGCPEAPATAEIWEIQGPGPFSPYAFRRLSTRANVVTAVGPAGFFLQTPEGRSDGDARTSDGIYVYTGAAPSVRPGDLADVSGLVVEYFGLTELTRSPLVTVVARDQPLPPPVIFDAGRPSPRAGLERELERYEGMLVELSGGIACGPIDRFGELPVVARSTRAFRGPGLLHPGLPGLPLWDGHPELFELRPGALRPQGAAPGLLAAGTRIDHCFGPLTFAFGEYQLWPLGLEVSAAPAPRPVRNRAAGEITVATQNLFRLYDDVDDPLIPDPVPGAAEYRLRLAKHSLAIRTFLGAPDILAVQEVENLQTLEALAARIAADDAGVRYRALLIEGTDPSGIDIGFLVREKVDVCSLRQIGAGETFTHDGSLHPLFPRPPLLLGCSLEGTIPPLRLTLIAVHLRSLRDIETSLFVRRWRFEQALRLAAAVQELQENDPEIHLIVLGDLNAFEFTDGYVDVLGIISGRQDPRGALLAAPDLVEPDLHNHVLDLPAGERYSYVFRGAAQALDHALTSRALRPRVRQAGFARGNADFPEALLLDLRTPLRSSDHDGLVLFIQADAGSPFRRGDLDGDGALEVRDALVLLRWLFAGGGPPSCPEAADCDGDGKLGLSDAIRLLLHISAAGPPPAAPYPECGRSPGGLGCTGATGCR
jgi:endonuclease/exonuclease/phosphatase family metal-dependent hydrolase